MIRMLWSKNDDKCVSCGCQPSEERFCDLVGIDLGSVAIIICNSCALDLVKHLIENYYGIWGQALMNADSVEAEREACAAIVDDFAERVPSRTNEKRYRRIATYIRSRGD